MAFSQAKNEQLWHTMPKRIKPWQACLGTKSDRLVPGNVGELEPEPAQPKGRSYAHQELQPATVLWADVVHATDHDQKTGNRYYQTKFN